MIKIIFALVFIAGVLPMQSEAGREYRSYRSKPNRPNAECVKSPMETCGALVPTVGTARGTQPGLEDLISLCTQTRLFGKCVQGYLDKCIPAQQQNLFADLTKSLSDMERVCAPLSRISGGQGKKKRQADYSPLFAGELFQR